VYDAVERLTEIQKDGLVELKPFDLKLTTKAIPFVSILLVEVRV
jgi:hypothetical protein